MAGDGASAGEVYVSVLPDDSTFWSRFVAQNRTQASKVGDDLGGVVGKAIADAIAKGIRDGFGKTPREPAARSGAESGGAFADAFKKRVEAALRSLPKAQIGAATTEAEQKIRDLRVALERLSGKKVGVDIDAATAVAELNRIRSDLDRLGRDSADVQVRADTGAAVAQLAAVQAEVDRLDGRNVRIDVDASGAIAGVSNLAAAGITLGPALVPGAAAGAAAIAGILPAALGAAGGIGALILGVTGVVAAVKAMSAAEDQSAQSGSSLARNTLQQAAAADGLRSAQAALGNTVANVADQQRRAAQQVANAQRALVDARANADRAVQQSAQRVEDAERAVARAQRDAVTAQRALTSAREEARRANEDLANQAVDNGLAQRRAILSVQEAEQQLASVRANPAATQRQRAEAQLTYEEARQQLLELGQQGTRLAEDKADADRRGIDGSKQVVAAQERIGQAQETVADAERALSQARADAANTARTAGEQVRKAQQAVADAQAAQAAQARQSAFSVAQAQQAVVNAQRQVEQATVSAATAGGAAMQKLDQAMADLSPRGQEFARFLFGLKAPLLDLRHAAEEGLLPGVQSGIESLLTVLPTAITLTSRYATSVGGLAAAAGRAFAQPYWVNFATDLTDTAIPAMENAAQVTYNLAVGVSGLVRAFLPLSGDIGGGLLRFSRDFALYGLTLQNTAGYRQFLDYVRTVGPEVAATVSEVAQAVFRIVQAVAPIGSVSLTTIRLFAETINALPVGVLTALAAGIIGVTTATKLLSFQRLIAETNLFAGAQLLLSETLVGARVAMAAAGPEVGRFGTALAGVKGGAKGAVEGVGGLLGMVGLGGPLGIGLAVGAVLVATWANAHAQSAAKVAKHKQAVDDINDAIQRNSGLIDENVRKVAAKNAFDSGALQLAQKVGISVGDVTNAYIHGGTAVDQITSRLDEYIAAEQRATQTDAAHSTQHTTNIKNARELRENLVTQKQAVADNTAETAKNADKQKILDEAMKGVGATASTNLTPAQKALGLALRTVADATSSATDKANALKAADDAVFGATRNAIVTEQDHALSLLQVAEAGKRNADQHLFGKATLDLNSEAGIRNRQMLEEKFLALGREYLAEVRAGVGVDEASKKHDINRDALIKAAQAAHFDAGEVDKLARNFGTLPTNPTVQVSVLGVAEAMTKLETAQIAEFGLRNGLDPAEARRQWNQQKDPLRRATGGPVFGPGGPTDDRVPAIGPGGVRYLLSDDEHIVTAAEVNAAGGHDRIVAWRKWLLGGGRLLPPAYAAGGPVPRPKTQPHLAVSWPFEFPMRVKIPPPASFGGGESFGHWPSSPAAQRGDSGVWRSVVALIRSTGPLSGSFGNAYRAGDPLWHGSGRAVDWMGYNQDALASFLAARRPLELIHRTGRRDYAYTRGVNKGSFDSSLMEAHRNHIHIAMAAGGRVERMGRYADTGRTHLRNFDSGGPLLPGLTYAYNGTGQTEWVMSNDQMAAIAAGGGRGWSGDMHVHGRDHSVTELAKAVAAELSWQMT